MNNTGNNVTNFIPWKEALFQSLQANTGKRYDFTKSEQDLWSSCKDSADMLGPYISGGVTEEQSVLFFSCAERFIQYTLQFEKVETTFEVRSSKEMLVSVRGDKDLIPISVLSISARCASVIRSTGKNKQEREYLWEKAQQEFCNIIRESFPSPPLVNHVSIPPNFANRLAKLAKFQ